MMRLFLFIFILISSQSSLISLPTVVPDPVPCVEFLELNFFESTIVYQSLSLHFVKQELWSPIVQLLNEKSREVPQRMKVKTAYLVPNPIEYPMNKAKTEKILKQVLYEVFVDVMRFYNTNEQPQMDLIFNDIFQRRLPYWQSCFGRREPR